MKATLLIKNIKNLYTCNENFDVFSEAFIAIHHEYIIDLGTHDFKKWMDSSTRVLDAQGECVIPAFIEPCYRGVPQEKSGDQIRNENEVAYAMRSNGILTITTPYTQLQRKDIFQDIIKRRIKPEYPIVSSIHEYMKNPKDKFLLSCGIGNTEYSLYSMHPLAFYMYNCLHVDLETIIKSITLWPAKTYKYTDRGQIAKGMRADLLVLHTKTIEEYLTTMGVPLIRRMIKNGIPVFPDIIRC